MTPFNYESTSSHAPDINRVMARYVELEAEKSKPRLTMDKIRAMSDDELDLIIDHKCQENFGYSGLLIEERSRRRELKRIQSRDFFDRCDDAFGDAFIFWACGSVASLYIAIGMWGEIFIPWLENIF